MQEPVHTNHQQKTVPIGSRPEWKADEDLDKQEAYNAEKAAEEFHAKLAEGTTNANLEGGENAFTPDRRSKLAKRLFSEGNLPV